MKFRATILALCLGISLTPFIIFAPRASATYYGAWSSWHYTSKSGTLECAISRQKVGAWRWPGCNMAFRTRRIWLFNGAVWDTNEVQAQTVGLFRIWGVNVTAKYRFNGNFVTTDHSVTCTTWNFLGFDVDIPAAPNGWCGTWNDGGQNWGYLDVGANFRVSVIWRGIPMNVGHWTRARVWVDGGKSGGWGG